MELREFSDMFDTLADSYAFHAAFGEQSPNFALALNEYEKSYFLTKAQEELVIGLYNGVNYQSESFETTEEMRRYLAPLVMESELDPISGSSGMPLGMESSSKFFTLPEDLLFITFERVSLSEGKCAGHTTMDVVPTTQDEYLKVKRNPFRGANDRRALRLDLSDGVIEILCKYPVTKYYLRYLRRPHPIVLINLPDGLSIDGETSKRNCELHESLHQRILEMAVKTAINSRRPFARKDD